MREMGKGGQVLQRKGKVSDTDNSGAKQEVLIEGRWYDVTGWKHPGGSVIKLYAGKDLDATQAFLNFHVRSDKARKFLEARPSRAASNPAKDGREKIKGQSALLDDFDALTEELRAEGFFKPAPLHIIYRLVEIILMHAAGFYLFFNGANFWQQAAGIALLGLTSGRCGWLMHEGGHYSLSGNIFVDRTLQVVLYGVGCGMSGSWWRNQHNKHHSMPQKHGADPDLDTLPLVAFTEKVVKRIGFPMKLWLRMQGALFPLITCELVALGWQFFLHPRHVLRTKNIGEGLAMATRLAAWTYFITMPYGLVQSAGLYLTYNWFASTYIFTNFAVSHTHLPVVEKEDETVDWVRYAAIHTMNVHSGLGEGIFGLGWVDWWMSFLNFQIEHHLWPSMPQFRHPIVSKRVKALFEKHNLPYKSMSYVDSMIVTFQNLKQVGSDVFYG